MVRAKERRVTEAGFIGSRDCCVERKRTEEREQGIELVVVRCLAGCAAGIICRVVGCMAGCQAWRATLAWRGTTVRRCWLLFFGAAVCCCVGAVALDLG